MKSEVLTVEDALERGRVLPWALVRSLSAVVLGPVPEKIQTEELMEARFFDSREEIRIFRSNGRLRAARLTEGPEDVVIRRTYAVENPEFGKAITVCYFVEADEDGQCRLSSARLAGWEGIQ